MSSRRALHVAALLTAGLAAACTDVEYRLVVTYPDQASFDRARTVELFVAADTDCAQLTASTLAPRHVFEAHGAAPALGRLESGQVAFRAVVRDAACQRFLDGCVDPELGTGEATIRIALRAAPATGCAGGTSCRDGACVVVDAGAGDSGAGQDRTTDASAADAAPGDAGNGDRAPLDQGGNDAAPVDARQDAAVVSTFSPIALPSGGALESVDLVRTGNQTTIYIASSTRAFRSDDRGASWFECLGLRDWFWSIEAAPGDPQHVFISAESDLFESTDGCASWRPTGLAQEPWALRVRSDGSVLVGTESGLYRRDSASWSHVVTSAGDALVNAVEVDPTGRYWYVGSYGNGLLRSDDSGTTWHDANSGLTSPWIYRIALDPGDPLRLFAGTDDGLFRSTDGALQWTRVCTNCRDATAVSPADPDFVLSDGWDALHASTNGGDSFGGDVRSAGMELGEVTDIDFDPDQSGRVYAATDRGLFTAAGSNLIWMPADAAISYWEVSSIAVSRAASRSYLATAVGVLARDQAVPTWSILHQGYQYYSWTGHVFAPAGDSNTLFACGRQLMRSLDRGATFSALFTAAEPDGWAVSRVFSDGGAIFSGTHGRTWWSFDDGQSWEQSLVAGAGRAVQDLVVHFDGDDVLTVFATDTGIYYTLDGSSYPAANSGLSSLSTHALVRRSDGTYLAGNRDGVYLAADLSSTWQHHGLADMPVRDLFESAGVVIAATDVGVFWESSAATTASWTHLPGLDDRWPWSLGAGVDGELLVGTVGHGLFSAPMP